MIAERRRDLGRLRSLLVACALVLAAPRAASAREPAVFLYNGVSIDERAVAADHRMVLEQGLREQIDLLRSLAIRPEIAESLRAVPIRIDPNLREPGHYDETGLRLWDKVVPRDNPVLLHELLHVWLTHATGAQRARIDRAYAEARRSGRYPGSAYMLTNVGEFFAMTASVVLWGKAARLPFARDRVKTDMPDYYDWLVSSFGLNLADVAPSGEGSVTP